MDDDGLWLRLFGYPMLVRPAFLVLCSMVAVLGMQSGDSVGAIAGFVVVLTVSILIHELGHAWACAFFGVEVKRIVLHMFGGFVEHGDCTVRQKFFISAAGPTTSALLAAAALGVMTISRVEWTAEIASWFATLNLFLAVFNALPIHPMDGGQTLLAGLMLFARDRVAVRITGAIGCLCSVGVIVAGIWNGFVFAALFALYFLFSNLRLLRGMPGVTAPHG